MPFLNLKVDHISSKATIQRSHIFYTRLWRSQNPIYPKPQLSAPRYNTHASLWRSQSSISPEPQLSTPMYDTHASLWRSQSSIYPEPQLITPMYDTHARLWRSRTSIYPEPQLITPMYDTHARLWRSRTSSYPEPQLGDPRPLYTFQSLQQIPPILLHRIHLHPLIRRMRPSNIWSKRDHLHIWIVCS